MSNRDWRVYAALGLGFAAAVAVAFTVTFLVISGYREEHQNQRRSAASAYQAQAYEQAESYCFGMTGAEREKCLNVQSEAAQNEQRSEYDLRAQQEMSEWALGVLALSAFGFVVSSAGLVALIYTFHEQRKLTQAQTRALIEAVGATIQHSTKRMFGSDEHELEVVIYLRNSGQTAATPVGAEVGATFFAQLVEGSPIEGQADDRKDMATVASNMISATGRGRITATCRGGRWLRHLLDPEAKRTHIGTETCEPMSLYVSAKISYCDIFGKRHDFQESFSVSHLTDGETQIMLGSDPDFSPDLERERLRKLE